MWPVIRVGDRVSWMGSIDFGRREVRWTGTVLSVAVGVPDGYVRGDDGQHRPTIWHSAALVLADMPQHGEVDHFETEPRSIVQLDRLEIVEAATDERHIELSEAMTMTARAIIVCSCRMHTPRR